MSSTVVCPWCQTEAKQIESTEYRCPNPQCGKSFFTVEWNNAAYRNPSELERHNVKITGISGNSIQNIYPLREGKTVYFNVDKNGVIRLDVNEADPDQSEKTIAEIYSHNKHEFWIIDRGCPTPIKVTGEEKYNAIINWGDTITFADGIEFKYTSKGIKGINRKTEPNESICIKAIEISSGDILKNISFYAKSGDFIGILGPSGSGKSSFIQRLIGLAPIDDGGDILINEKKLDDCKDQFLSICAYVPQQTTLHESLTIEQECYTYARLVLPDVSCLDESISNVLHLVDLENDRKKVIRVLSGGQKKRLGIALELLREPQVLILDEPTSGLDPASETKIMNHLHALAKQGKIVLCTTHSMPSIDQFDKLLILSQRKEVFFGSKDEALNHFNTSSFEEIYNRLAEDDPNKPKRDYEKQFHNPDLDLYKNLKDKLSLDDIKSALPCAKRANCFRQLWAYLIRNFLYYWHNKSWIIQLIIQPVLIAFVIKCACAGKFYDPMGLSDTFFFCLMSMFWLGMNNSVRELVSQRIPGRCLERMEQVPLSVYLSSKWIWMTLVCSIQTLLFTLVLYLPVLRLSVEQPKQYLLTSSWEIMGIFWGMCIIGYLIGLAVSAIFKTQTSAVAMLPIIVIPVILLSKPVINVTPKEPNFTHVFLVSGLAFALVILILSSFFVSKRFKGAAVYYMAISFLTVAALYSGLANYYRLFDSPKPSDNENNSLDYSGLAEKLQALSPCYMPLQLINVENEYARAKREYIAAETEIREHKANSDASNSVKEQEKKKKASLYNITIENEKRSRIMPYYILGLLTYAALSVTLTIVFQYIREKEWEGR